MREGREEDLGTLFHLHSLLASLLLAASLLVLGLDDAPPLLPLRLLPSGRALGEPSGPPQLWYGFLLACGGSPSTLASGAGCTQWVGQLIMGWER